MAKALLAVMIVSLVLLLGCTGPAPPQPPAQNQTQLNWAAGDAKPYAAASNLFGYSLFSELAKTSGDRNLVFSPYSVSSAMTIAYEGAGGKTATEMAAAMHLPADKGTLRGSFAGLYGKLNSAGSGVELSTANAIWVHKDYQLKEGYLAVLRDAYAAGATNLDFSGGAEGIINNWVEQRTNGKIKDLIPSGALSPMAPVVITNAVYFKGKWEQEFDKSKTQKEDFSLVSGEKVQAMMMGRLYENNRTNYAEDGAAQAIELPYQGRNTSMVLILPKEEGAGGIGFVEQELADGKLAQWRAALTPEKVSIYMPKFRLEETYGLEKVLSGMGMPTAFSDAADFGNMTDERNLKIGRVIHKVYVDVDEEGTEAAAATAVIMQATAYPMPEQIKVFRADRPFFFAIVEKDSGAVLFLGKVMDPRG